MNVEKLIERLRTWADAHDMGRAPDPSDLHRQAAEALSRQKAAGDRLHALLSSACYEGIDMQSDEACDALTAWNSIEQGDGA